MYELIIADDEPLIRTGLYYRVDWQSLGFHVIAVVEDGSEVIKILEKQKVDVLLTDIRMYNVSGLDVARLIYEKYPWVKVVLLSGYQEFEYAREAMHSGVYEYLTKPINYEELNEVFKKISEELNRVLYEENLLHSIGKAEYEKIIQILQMVNGTVKGENSGNWLLYIRLKPLMEKLPPEIKNVLVKKIVNQLFIALKQKNEEMAQDFISKIRLLDMDNSTISQDQFSKILKELGDKLVLENTLQPVKNCYDDSINKACKYIENHLNEDFTYRDVADFIGLSPRHFIRKFHQEIGLTFSQYITEKRMEGAVKLLDEKTVSYQDVGSAVGYHDEKYFQQLFKKYQGCSAKEYVRLNSHLKNRGLGNIE